jgi:signal transduction histidine kinase
MADQEFETIRENGAGFEVDQVMSGGLIERGLGLAGMKERTTLSEGNYSLNRTKGAGTSIRASRERKMVPL